MNRFECVCGKRLKIKDSMAGRIVKCPACRSMVRAPAAKAAVRVTEGRKALVMALKERKAPSTPPPPPLPEIPVATEPKAAVSAPAVPAAPPLPFADPRADRVAASLGALAQAMQTTQAVEANGDALASLAKHMAKANGGALASFAGGTGKSGGSDPAQPAIPIRKSKGRLVTWVVAAIATIGFIAMFAIAYLNNHR